MMNAINIVVEQKVASRNIQLPVWAQIRFIRQGLLVAMVVGAMIAIGSSLAISSFQFSSPLEQLKFSIELEKPTIMLGEPTFLVFTIENLSDQNLFAINHQSRNQYGRPESYSVVAKPIDGGPEVELLKLDQPSFGGISAGVEIPANNKWSKKLFLPNWFLLKAPGAYEITCRTNAHIGTTQLAASTSFNNGISRAWLNKPDLNRLQEKEDALVESKQLAVIDVELATKLTVLPFDKTKMGEVINSFGTAALAQRQCDEARAAMKQLLAINDSRTVTYFVQAMSRPDYSIRFSALGGLAKFDSDEALAGIEMGLSTTKEDVRGAYARGVRHAAANALSRSPHPKAEARLLSLVDHSEYEIQLTVVHRLGRMTSDESLQLLKLKSRNAFNDMVRGEAIRYIKERLRNDRANEDEPSAMYIEFLRELIPKYRAAYNRANDISTVDGPNSKPFAFHWLETAQARLAMEENRISDAIIHWQKAVDEAKRLHEQKKKFYDTHHAPSGSSEHTWPVTQAHTRMFLANGELQVAQQKLDEQNSGMASPKANHSATQPVHLTLPNQSESTMSDEDTVLIEGFKKTLKDQLPEGWSIERNGNGLKVQRDQKTLMLAVIGLRAKNPDETQAEYDEDMGARINLNVGLHFKPRLSDESWLELAAHRADVVEAGKDGFKSKMELGEHADLVEKYRLPTYETPQFSIFQNDNLGWSRLTDANVIKELAEVMSILRKTLPVNRGMAADAQRPQLRWPQVWIDNAPGASISLNKTVAEPLKSAQLFECFSRDAGGGILNPQWVATIDWKDVSDFDSWIKQNPQLADDAQKHPHTEPRVEVVRFSKHQIEVKVVRSVGLYFGRNHYAVAKHFRIERTPDVDAIFGLDALEAKHLTTFKEIGKGDSQARAVEVLGKPDQSRVLQNGDRYDYYLAVNITLFYRNQIVHAVSLSVPEDVQQ